MRRIFFLFFLLPFYSVSQPFIDLVTIYYHYSPTLKETFSETGPYDIKTRQIYLGLNLPLRVDSDYVVLNPSYEIFNAHLKKERDHYFTGLFQVVSFPVTWQHQWNSPWKTAFIFIPRLSGDSRYNFSGDRMRYGGAILNTWKRHATLKYKFGIYYNHEFFGPFVLPLLGIDWNITPRLNLFGVLPGSMNLEIKAGKRVHTGLAFRSITTSHYSQKGNYLRVYDNHLRLFLDIYFTKSQVLSIEGGHSVLRKYRSFTLQDGDPDYHNLKAADGFLFKISYNFRKRTDG